MKHQKIILIGAGGHALSLAEFAGENFAGYLAPSPNPDMPFPWLGDDSKAGSYPEVHIAFVYAGLPLMQRRRTLIDYYEKSGAKFVSLISPTAIVTPSSRIEEGCAVMAGAIVNRASLGRNVVVNSGAIVEHDCTIGDNTFIGPGAVIGGFTSIGENCFIGLGARIANNITIADNITIAMGAVVNRNLTEPGIYHGTPLRRFPLNKIKS